MNINMNQNPFRDSSLKQSVSTKASARALTPEEEEQERKRRARENTKNTRNFVEQRLLGRNANAERKRRNSKDNPSAETAAIARPPSMEQKMQQLSEQKHEVYAMKRQLASSNDPIMKRKLEEMFGTKVQASSALESEISLMFRGPGGGFVGSEGKIDYITNFVAVG